MQLVSWWAWEFDGEDAGSPGITFSHQLNLPSGTYSAFCALNAATVNAAPNPLNGLACGILWYTANNEVVSAPTGYGFPLIFPTDNLTEINFNFAVLATSNGAGYVNVSGWQ
jgi:hypothetical protein